MITPGSPPKSTPTALARGCAVQLKVFIYLAPASRVRYRGFRSMIFVGSIRASIESKERIIDPRIICRAENISTAGITFSREYPRALSPPKRIWREIRVPRKIDRHLHLTFPPWPFPVDRVFLARLGLLNCDFRHAITAETGFRGQNGERRAEGGDGCPLHFARGRIETTINNCPPLIARRCVSLVSVGPQTTSLTFIHWARKKFRNTNRFMYRRFVLVAETLERLPRGFARDETLSFSPRFDGIWRRVTLCRVAPPQIHVDGPFVRFSWHCGTSKRVKDTDFSFRPLAIFP